jgi:two-component system catabolic regulation response regulator CreB/two-component system response regulator ChvI
LILTWLNNDYQEWLNNDYLLDGLEISILNNIVQRKIKSSSVRILIVDDDPDITFTFRAGLEKNGFIVTVFNDPLKVLSKFTAGLYDFVLIDVKMPKMNGFELYGEIERIDNNLKVCFMTAFVVYYESLREIFPTTRVSCFIKKPIEIDKLVDRIIKQLNSSDAADNSNSKILPSDHSKQSNSNIST